MKLKHLDPIAAANELKNVLIKGNFIDKDGVVSNNDIFIGSNPISGLPNNFVVIRQNGASRDLNEYGECVLLLEVSTILTSNKLPNTNKQSFILGKLSDIFDSPINSGNYTFFVRKGQSVSDSISLQSGYGTKLVNIFCRIIVKN